MRHQWDIQVKSALGIGCGGLKLGRKIQEKKNIGLISPCLHEAIREFVTIQGKHKLYKDKRIVMCV